jgi:hypothetical protein
MDKQKQAARLVDDLQHLGRELSQLHLASLTLQPGTASWARNERETREVNETFSSKEARLLAIAGREPMAGAQAFAELGWARAERELREEGVLPLTKPAPSAVGGARYVREIPVSNYMVPAFLDALGEMRGAVVSTRPSIGCKGVVFDTTYYTISLESVDDQFEVATLMVLNYYATKQEKGAVRS